MRYEIRLSPVAINDVQEIMAYIAEDNPTAAEEVGNAFISVYRILNGVRDYLSVLFSDELSEDPAP